MLHGLKCERGINVLKLLISLSHSMTEYCKFNLAPHDKEFSKDQKKKKELFLYIKMTKTVGLPTP